MTFSITTQIKKMICSSKIFVKNIFRSVIMVTKCCISILVTVPDGRQYANSMASFARFSDALPVTWRHKRYFWNNCYNSFIFKLKTSSKTKMILDVICNDPNHKNDTFIQKNRRKTSFTNVAMVTKMLHVCISITVPDRPTVTIIHR